MHKHEYEFLEGFRCECGHTLPWKEAIRRLNTFDQLEAANNFLLSCIEEGQICEACPRVATKTTHDGVDVCHICWGEMASDAAEAALEAGGK